MEFVNKMVPLDGILVASIMVLFTSAILFFSAWWMSLKEHKSIKAYNMKHILAGLSLTAAMIGMLMLVIYGSANLYYEAIK